VTQSKPVSAMQVYNLSLGYPIQARPQGRATGASAQGPQKYGAPKLNYVLTTSAISQKKKLLVLVLYNLSIW